MNVHSTSLPECSTSLIKVDMVLVILVNCRLIVTILRHSSSDILTFINTFHCFSLHFDTRPNITISGLTSL